jgi:uncharacterized membrane protein YhaH (DUF805 family)
MNFVQAIKACFVKYFTFKGRALRSEFWQWWVFIWVLMSVIGWVVFRAVFYVDMGYLSYYLSYSYYATLFAIVVVILVALFFLLLLLAGLAVSSRRLHDVNKSGWWVLLIPFTTIAQIFLGFLIIIVCGVENGILERFIHSVVTLSCLLLYGNILYWYCKNGDCTTNKYGPAEYQF